MAKLIDPIKYGLHTRTLIEEIDQETKALVMHRKTSTPICSKTQIYLEKEGIEVLPVDI